MNYGVDVSSTATLGLGDDYTLSPASSVVFNPGETTKTIAVQVVDNLVVEPSETVIVNLFAGAGYGLGSFTSATVTISP